MEMGEKEKELEMPSSSRCYTSDQETGTRPETEHQTLHHLHRRLPPPTTERNKPTSRVPDPDPDPDPVSATPVSPLPRSYARPFLSPHQQQRVRYRECQRNHAATSGGHVLDGCGEFMPAGDEGTAESLRCAACDCHRSFHRREIEGEVTLNLNTYGHYNNNMVNARKVSSHKDQAFPPPPLLLHHHHVSPIMMSFGGGGGGAAESSTEDLNKFQCFGTNGADQLQQQPKKRSRTKFNQEQKEKMQEFADKIGWRISKQDEEEVQRFCSRINVKRQVFKVWMHNNKQAAKKKQM